MNFSCNGLQTPQSGISLTETHRHTKCFQNYNCFHCFRSRNFRMCFFLTLTLLWFPHLTTFSETYILPMAESSKYLSQDQGWRENTASARFWVWTTVVWSTTGYAGKFLTLYLTNLPCIFLFNNCTLLHTDRLILVSFISNETLKHCIWNQQTWKHLPLTL